MCRSNLTDMLALAALLLTASAAPAAPAAPSPALPPSFVERRCSDAALAKAARCGTVNVPEDRSLPGGRTIGLNIVILPAVAPNPDLPPQYDFEGGPGLAVTESAAFYLSDGAAYRAHRDIVLIDQRGTGGSNRLSCASLEALESSSREIYPAAAVAACKAEILTHSNPVHYGTSAALEDVDSVRAALGHDRIDLVALSYGTTVALRYIATRPGIVRAAILMSVAPPSAMPPRDHAPVAERALSLLFSRCLEDSACRAAIPDPEADLRAALARLPGTRPGLSRDAFMERIRTLLYQPGSARKIPWIVHRAAAGDLAPFDASSRPQGPSRFALGQYLSITCGESLGLMDFEEAARRSRSTRFGDYRLRRQREACGKWPAVRVAPDHLAPISSDTAILMISGGLDPVTPPAWADALAATLPRSRHIVIRDSGHVFDGMSGVDTCLDPLMIRFLETADPASLDARCIESMKAPAFAVSSPAPLPT